MVGARSASSVFAIASPPVSPSPPQLYAYFSPGARDERASPLVISPDGYGEAEQAAFGMSAWLALVLVLVGAAYLSRGDRARGARGSGTAGGRSGAAAGVPLVRRREATMMRERRRQSILFPCDAMEEEEEEAMVVAVAEAEAKQGAEVEAAEDGEEADPATSLQPRQANVCHAPFGTGRSGTQQQPAGMDAEVEAEAETQPLGKAAAAAAEDSALGVAISSAHPLGSWRAVAAKAEALNATARRVAGGVSHMLCLCTGSRAAARAAALLVWPLITLTLFALALGSVTLLVACVGPLLFGLTMVTALAASGIAYAPCLLLRAFA